jgi:transcriptional regulator with XRE-family HTH domain
MLYKHKFRKGIPMIATNEEFGARIKELREVSNLTQSDLADRLGVSQSTLSRLEDGTRSVTARQLVQISDALGVSLNRLVASEGALETTHLRAGDADAGSVTDSLRVFDECIDQFRGVQALAG